MKSAHISKEDNFREFYESVGQRYPEEEFVYRTLRGRVRKEFIVSYLKEFHGRFLDLGCNRGMYLELYQNGGRVGVDIAYSVVAIAKQRFPRSNVVQGDAQNLQFLRSNSFDSILCSEMIEHVPLPDKVISGCFRILRPGGRLLITTPNYKRQKPAWISIGSMKKHGIQGVKQDAYFHTAFRPEELKNLVEEAGFRVLEFGTFEKEVKYSTRIPVSFYHTLAIMNKFILKSEKIAQLNESMLEQGSLIIYRMCCFLGLNKILTALVKEGVRTFLLAEKFTRSEPNQHSHE
ncbi:MAG: class I SAM-dependent methyltransferase [bacterium]